MHKKENKWSESNKYAKKDFNINGEFINLKIKKDIRMISEIKKLHRIQGLSGKYKLSFLYVVPFEM
jgi:hypothetical protein